MDYLILKSSRFQLWLRMVIFWTLAFLFFIFLRYYGQGEFRGTALEFNPGVHIMFSTCVFLGIFTGTFYIMVEDYFNRLYFKLNRIPYGLILIFKAGVFLILVKLFILLAIIWNTYRVAGFIDWDRAIQAISSKNFRVTFIYFLAVSAGLSFFMQMDQKFGPGVLWKMLRGWYLKPREEERIFMFLDMKSSTTIAEHLGHIRYSQLIQDCFADITKAVLDSQAEIYQYVGDEVVLSWIKQEGLRNNNCIRAFYIYQEILNSKSDYYTTQYGLIPEFKAGLHVGKTIVSEVGILKREIAYHGDVLNTAARIQGECNKYNLKLLLSKELLKDLTDQTKDTVKLGELLLRGKQSMVELYGFQS